MPRPRSCVADRLDALPLSVQRGVSWTATQHGPSAPFQRLCELGARLRRARLNDSLALPSSEAPGLRLEEPREAALLPRTSRRSRRYQLESPVGA